jgi:hypothetical protein
MNRYVQVGPTVGKHWSPLARVLLIIVVVFLLVSGFPNPAQAADPYSNAYVWGDWGAGVVLFNNGDTNGVNNNPPRPTTFTTSSTITIASITTYHWNAGKGAAPGTIGLRDGNGNEVGSWPAAALGDNITFWYVRPKVKIGPGTYTVIDSSPMTWSYTRQSGEMGFTLVVMDNDAPDLLELALDGPLEAARGSDLQYVATATNSGLRPLSGIFIGVFSRYVTAPSVQAPPGWTCKVEEKPAIELPGGASNWIDAQEYGWINAEEWLVCGSGTLKPGESASLTAVFSGADTQVIGRHTDWVRASAGAQCPDNPSPCYSGARLDLVIK